MKINNSDPIFIDNFDDSIQTQKIESEKLAQSISKIFNDETLTTPLSPSGLELKQIAGKFDLTNELEIKLAIQHSAEYLVKARLGKKLKTKGTTEKIIKELGGLIAEDPFLQGKILSILQNLKHNSH